MTGTVEENGGREDIVSRIRSEAKTFAFVSRVWPIGIEHVFFKMKARRKKPHRSEVAPKQLTFLRQEKYNQKFMLKTFGLRIK